VPLCLFLIFSKKKIPNKNDFIWPLKCQIGTWLPFFTFPPLKNLQKYKNVAQGKFVCFEASKVTIVH
jgi:hypothetical protein